MEYSKRTAIILSILSGIVFISGCTSQTSQSSANNTTSITSGSLTPLEIKMLDKSGYPTLFVTLTNPVEKRLLLVLLDPTGNQVASNRIGAGSASDELSLLGFYSESPPSGSYTLEVGTDEGEIFQTIPVSFIGPKAEIVNITVNWEYSKYWDWKISKITLRVKNAGDIPIYFERLTATALASASGAKNITDYSSLYSASVDGGKSKDIEADNVISYILAGENSLWLELQSTSGEKISYYSKVTPAY